MNNEPVAWMYKDEENAMVSFRRDTLPFDAVPLYTHPAEHDLGIAEAIGFEKVYKAAPTKTLTDSDFKEIEILLDGIDRNMCEIPDGGWWETSVGVRFGNTKVGKNCDGALNTDKCEVRKSVIIKVTCSLFKAVLSS